MGARSVSESLQSEVARREAAFISKLTRAGLDDLVCDYKDIVTLREAIEVTSKRVTRISRNSDRESAVSTPTPDGFVLMDAVRTAIASVNGERFRMSGIFGILQRQYPSYITLEKRGSIGATLSNLAAAGELRRETDGQRKVWYRAVNVDPAWGFDEDGNEIDTE